MQIFLRIIQYIKQQFGLNFLKIFFVTFFRHKQSLNPWLELKYSIHVYKI